MPWLRPAYWAEACRHLMKRDRVMKKLIPQFPDAMLQSAAMPSRPWRAASWASRSRSSRRRRSGTASSSCRPA